MITLTGKVSRVLFANDNGFHVLSVDVAASDGGENGHGHYGKSGKSSDGHGGKTQAQEHQQGAGGHGFSSGQSSDEKTGNGAETVVGVGADIREGENIIATGSWAAHPRFGRQFKATSLVNEPPTDSSGLLAYLKSGAIKGIGPTMAQRLYDQFGDGLREALGNEQALSTVRGIGAVTAAKIADDWLEASESREAMILLQGIGLGSGRARAVWNLHRTATISNVKENPYRALLPVPGIGFRIADDAARELGIDRRHPDRVFSGLRHVVDELAQAGHTAGQRDEIISAGSKLLGLHPLEIIPHLDWVVSKGRLQALSADRLGLPWLLEAERFIAERLHDMAQTPMPIPAMAHHPRTHDGHLLTGEQADAVRSILGKQFAILTGGPGAGKTTVTHVVADALASEKLDIALCAPTGRAARRLREATGRNTSTIHKLLEAGPEGFARNADNHLTHQAVIVDEASMVDVPLMLSLIQALPEGCRLVLVGDPDQLPAVGPGNVLRDLNDSGVIPVARLKEIHRQAGNSRIITQSRCVNDGLSPTSGDDFQIVAIEDSSAEDLAQEVNETVKELAEAGYDPFTDVQVLTPMHKGPLGTAALNELLRDTLGVSTAATIKLRGREWALGDKVVQMANDYELEVMNGDLGIVRRFDQEASTLTVNFEGRDVTYNAQALANLQLAYALTGHKAQGSEFPVVIIPLSTSHWHMLERQWLYTAITRGKRHVVLVANPKALKRAVTHLSGRRRMTTLQERLVDLTKQQSQEAPLC